ncbi:MAG TPA: RHS repeat-associated core domain-containing protein, partial [Clostridia bacterium]|nr:RHS repeat-associated core domain-containing protein [Clostridia bacterium]
EESGQYHTWFRQYSPNAGRWLTPDPAGLAAVDLLNPQSWNRYAYVMNRPTNLIDPLGLGDCGPGTVEDFIPNSPGSVVVEVSRPCPSLSNAGALPTGFAFGWPTGGGSVAQMELMVDGDSGGSTAPANNGKNCPSVPTHPGYANINANMAAAKSAPFAMYSFYKLVRNHGPWDYKQAKNLNDFGQIIPKSPFEDFGNFNYGATAASLGLPLSVTLRAAGYAGVKSDTGSTWDAIKAALGSAPYGDDSHDQQLIVNGYNFSGQGCNE